MTGQELWEKIKTAIKKEHEASIEVLRLLREVEACRRLQAMAELIKKLAKIALGRLEKKNSAANEAPYHEKKNPERRKPPASTRRQVWQRDQGQCT